MKSTFNHVRAIPSSLPSRRPLRHVTSIRRVSADACKFYLIKSYHVSGTNRCWHSRGLTSGLVLLLSQQRATSGIEIWRREASCESGQERWLSHRAQRAKRGRPSNGINSLLEESWTTETVDVPVGGNGAVEVNISTLTPDATAAGEKTQLVRNVLVYLPPGPLPETMMRNPDGNVTDHDLEEYKALLEMVATTARTQDFEEDVLPSIVVRIKYRLSSLDGTKTSSPDHRYPSPIHDVSVAFEWILENITELCRTPTAIAQPGTDQIEHELYDNEPKISLFGSHIGGSLALMLALTQPNDIHALAVCDPIVDWVGLDEVAESILTDQSTKKRTRTDSDEARLSTQKEAKVLINLRTQLFRNPSGFFDSFASPILFLRAPGRDTPLWRTARPEPGGTTQDEEYLTELMKKDGGIPVSKLETDEVVSEMGYGPYDDDWHTAEHESTKQRNLYETATMPDLSNSAESGLQQLSTDLSTMSLADRIDGSAFEQDSTDLAKVSEADISQLTTNSISESEIVLNSKVHSHNSTIIQRFPLQSLNQALSGLDFNKRKIEPQPRRRKVLRRWPPIGLPEDVNLPWTKIYSTPPSSPSLTISEQTSQTSLTHVLHPQAKEMVDVMRRACFWGREKGLGEERVNIETIGPTRVELGMGDEMREDGLLFDNRMGQGDGKLDTLQAVATWLRAMSTIEK